MRQPNTLSTSLMTLLSLAVLTSAAQNAPVVQNAVGAYAIADMPSGGSKNIKAEISAATAADGQGVLMTVNINGGDPLTGGPFSKFDG
jgi:hypothetical protein